VGRFNVNPAPNGVTLINLVTSLHSKSGVSRQLIRTGSCSASRSLIRFQFRSSAMWEYSPKVVEKG
jgi:hypothetical protein